MASTSRSSFLTFIYFIILFGLVYAFRMELFVTGMRLYVSTVKSPRAEKLLGNYYQNNARLNENLSLSFYNSALKKYKEELQSANKLEVANIKLKIGQIYLCGKGVIQNPHEAKRWFKEAEQALTTGSTENEQEYAQLTKDIKESLLLAPNSDPNLLKACQLRIGIDFIKDILNL